MTPDEKDHIKFLRNGYITKFLGILLVIVYARLCGHVSPQYGSVIQKTNFTQTINTNNSSSFSTNSTQTPKHYNWTYSLHVDAITSTMKDYARCQSTNTIDFKAPYNGKSVFCITLREEGAPADIILSTSNGRFSLSNIKKETIQVRFDNNKEEKYTGTPLNAFIPDSLSINRANKFISKLKKAKKVIIKAEFSEEGLQLMEFNTEGLKWNH